MHLPDLSSGTSASLRFALGLRSLLDLHQTDEQLSSADSLAQAKSCAKNCASALGSTTDVVETPGWDEEAPGRAPCVSIWSLWDDPWRYRHVLGAFQTLQLLSMGAVYP